MSHFTAIYRASKMLKRYREKEWKNRKKTVQQRSTCYCNGAASHHHSAAIYLPAALCIPFLGMNQKVKINI